MFRKSSKPSLETRLAEAMFEQSPDGMLLIQNGVFTACNAASEKIYGYPRSRIIGGTPVDFSAPIQTDGRPVAECVNERLHEAFSNGSARFEWINLDNAGATKRILVTLLPTRIEGDQEVLVIVQSLAETAQVVDQLREGLEQLSRGNLTYQITTPFRSDYEGLRTSFNAAVDAIGSSMERVVKTAQMVAAGSSEIGGAAQDLSSRTEQQAVKVEATVNALHEIGNTMAQAARSAQTANAMVEQTRKSAEQSGDVVGRAVEAMGALEASSREISDIISVIDAIAFQTNLLALNAGVEAARGRCGARFCRGRIRSARLGPAQRRCRQGHQIAHSGFGRSGGKRRPSGDGNGQCPLAHCIGRGRDQRHGQRHCRRHQ